MEKGGDAKAYQFLTVGLVYAILHCFVDEFGVGRVCGEGGGEDRKTLQIKYLWEIVREPKARLTRGEGTYEVFPRVRLGQDLPRARSAQLKPRYDRDGPDALRPPKPNVMADPDRWLRRIQAPVLSSIRRVFRQHLAQRHGSRLRRRRVQLSQIRPDEPADERGGDVVWVPFDH